MPERDVVGAIHADDVEDFLEQLGILEQLDGDGIKCAVCGRPTLRNQVAALRLVQGNIEVCCDLLPCLEQFHG